MKLMTTTAAALLLSAPFAIAQEYGSDPMSTMHNNAMADSISTEEMASMDGDLIRSRDITGGTVYTMNASSDEWDTEAMWDTVDSNWEQIGTIEDLVLTSNGDMTGIVVEVGGFLDIGDKHVALSVQDLNLVAVDDQTYAYVTMYSEEQLEEMNSVDEGFWN